MASLVRPFLPDFLPQILTATFTLDLCVSAKAASTIPRGWQGQQGVYT